MVNYRKLFKISAVTLTFTGICAYKFCDNKLNASWTTNYEPSVKWDYNWDRREPECLIKPSTKPWSNSSSHKKHQSAPASLNHSNNDEVELNKKIPKASRVLILVRHGQYEINANEPQNRILTQLGAEQADYTGKRLKEMNWKYSKLYSSTMIRAIETAGIIQKYLPNDLPFEMDDILIEGAPIPPEPPVGHWKPEFYQFFQDGSRIEAAFRRYFYRADVEQTGDSYEILVCHANVIRYFICRCLQLPPEAWLRFDLKHASLTFIKIMPDGRVKCFGIGEAGHMPVSKLTA